MKIEFEEINFEVFIKEDGTLNWPDFKKSYNKLTGQNAFKTRLSVDLHNFVYGIQEHLKKN